MAKVTGPNMSMKSSGQIGHALVQGNWRGVPYVRSYATPSNPKTTAQTKTRSVFSYLSNAWKTMNAAVQAPWTAYAKGQAFTDRNAFIGKNTSLLRTAEHLEGMILSPGTGSGVIPAGMRVTPGSGKLTAVLTAPALPTGWAITAAHFIALIDGTPSSGTLNTASFYATKAETPFTVDITLSPATYVVFGFFQYLRADGKIAYSPSIFAPGTVAE